MGLPPVVRGWSGRAGRCCRSPALAPRRSRGTTTIPDRLRRIESACGVGADRVGGRSHRIRRPIDLVAARSWGPAIVSKHDRYDGGDGGHVYLSRHADYGRGSVVVGARHRTVGSELRPVNPKRWSVNLLGERADYCRHGVVVRCSLGSGAAHLGAMDLAFRWAGPGCGGTDNAGRAVV